MLYKLPESADDANNPITRLIASPFPARIAIDFQKRFAVRGIETWGMTEVTVPIWQPLDEPLRVGCCGKLREDYFEMKIVDPETDFELPMGSVGEMVLRPKYPFTIMQGYFSMPEVTISTWKNLWFHTGDLAKMDDEGYVYFADRISERIRRRAENVSSFEIEAAALSHPSITECAAVGVPSEFESDDDIKLTLVLQKGEILPPEDLMTYLIPLLPHFMVPRYLEYVNELARTPTGKILKGTLKKMGINENVWDRKSSSISIRQVIK
jgi:crotonobetaine/carnitine-CoA ligase